MELKKTVPFLLILLLPNVLEAKDPEKPRAVGSTFHKRNVNDTGGDRLGPREEMRQKIKTIQSLLDEVSALAEICGACDSNPCLNGGTCYEEKGGKYSCKCAIGWKGDRCDACNKALGMEDGAISDGKITASSEEVGYEASKGRLNYKEESSGELRSWSAREKNFNQYLQIDLRSGNRNVSGIATQGGKNYRNKARWVTNYKLMFSDDGVNFQYYKGEGQATEQVFVGNKDLDSVVFHDLNPPITARYIRIVPTAWKNWICMRVELYGCEEIKACESSPCLNNGTCIDEPGGNYSCQCKGGWKGDQCEGLDAMGLENSAIIGKNSGQLDALGNWLKSVTPSDRQWKLCFRASENGWAASTFHSLCDGKGPTVSIIKVDKYIFGGYTSTSWTTSCGYKSDSKAFLFSLINKPGWAPVKLPQTGQHASSYSYSIYSCSNYGPTFGGGHDLNIADAASSNTNSYTNLGHSYSPPNGHAYSSTFAKSFLAGNYNFQPDEVETFYEST